MPEGTFSDDTIHMYFWESPGRTYSICCTIHNRIRHHSFASPVPIGPEIAGVGGSNSGGDRGGG